MLRMMTTRAHHVRHGFSVPGHATKDQASLHLRHTMIPVLELGSKDWDIFGEGAGRGGGGGRLS